MKPERPFPRPAPVDQACATYEAAKQRWIAEHPEATQEEYQLAMQRIARECGV